MSVQLSAKIQPGGESKRSCALKLHDIQTELSALELVIRHTLRLFTAAKFTVSRFQSNPSVVALYKQCTCCGCTSPLVDKCSEDRKDTKTQMESSCADRAVVTISPKKAAEERVPIYESNFIVYLKNRPFVKVWLFVVGASGESSVLIDDVVKSVDRYTVLLMKLEREQLHLLDLTRSIISCTKNS